MLIRLAAVMLVCAVAAGCRPAQEAPEIDASLRVDGSEISLAFNEQVTVDQLLASAQIELGERDRISHPLVAPVADGMVITIRRVQEKQTCQQQEIAYESLQFPREGIAPGEKRVGQAGSPGLREACYRVIYEDGIETETLLSGDPIVVREPVAEITYISVSAEAQPLEIPGRLSYINHGNAWTIRGNLRDKRPLTERHKLDSLVFHQSADGARLLFTSTAEASADFFNALWLLDIAAGAEPIRLPPTDVLYAEWRPYTANAIAYSTGERSAGAPGWKALNNLWLITLDLKSGRALTIDEALPESSGGQLGWWGTYFAWSPHGDRMAWARADGMGLVDFEEKTLKRLTSYARFQSGGSWVWLSQLSWSYDNEMIASIVHAAPLGDEPPEKSPAFDITVSSADGSFSAALEKSAGMWAAPSFSPNVAPPASEFGSGYLAWLQAREPHNSMNGDYDLVIADRDGSNKRRVFPAADAPGIRKTDAGLTPRQFAWSPDGRYIAIVYRGDLWLVARESGQAQQVTFDGGSAHPVWTM